jgi:hypothetical protein
VKVILDLGNQTLNPAAEILTGAADMSTDRFRILDNERIG